MIISARSKQFNPTRRRSAFRSAGAGKTVDYSPSGSGRTALRTTAPCPPPPPHSLALRFCFCSPPTLLTSARSKALNILQLILRWGNTPRKSRARRFTVLNAGARRRQTFSSQRSGQTGLQPACSLPSLEISNKATVGRIRFESTAASATVSEQSRRWSKRVRKHCSPRHGPARRHAHAKRAVAREQHRRHADTRRDHAERGPTGRVACHRNRIAP